MLHIHIKKFWRICGYFPRSCMLSTFINELTCGHWTTVVFIELLVYIELTKKLICTCSPTLVLTKGTKAHQRKVSSARLIVYTAHFIRAGLDFQDHVPVLSVLGLPLDMVRARWNFGAARMGQSRLHELNLSVPNQFFWYAYFFHPSRAKDFRPCKWGLSDMQISKTRVLKITCMHNSRQYIQHIQRNLTFCINMNLMNRPNRHWTVVRYPVAERSLISNFSSNGAH